MAMLKPEDDRQTERKRVLKGAKIAYAARCSSLPCVVRDISGTGARLQVKDHASIPDTFELLIDLDGFEVDAEVIWRKQGEVGVIFLTEPTMVKPKRTQTISSSVPKRKGSLRREKPQHPRSVPHDEAAQGTGREISGQPGISSEVNQGDQAERSADSLDAVDATDQELSAGVEQVPAASGTCPAAETTGVELTQNTEDVSCVAPQQPSSHELEDDITMNQVTPGSSACATDEGDDIPAQVEDDSQQSVPEQSLEVVTRTEVPMFRDQVVEDTRPAVDEEAVEADPMVDFVDETMPVDPEPDELETQVETGEPATGLIDAGSLADTVAHFQEPFRSRVKTAFLAPARAAENMARPEVPIIPAPAADAPVADASPDLREATTETAETPEEVAAASEPVVSAETADISAVLQDLRPDLAAFVKLFAPASIETPKAGSADTDESASTGSGPATQIVAAPAVEPEPVEGLDDGPSGTSMDESNAGQEEASVVEIITARESSGNNDVEVDSPAPAQMIEIVDDVIVCGEPADASMVPNFCEMQIGEPAAEVEMLPCPGADGYVAAVAEAAVEPELPVSPASPLDDVSELDFEAADPVSEDLTGDDEPAVTANTMRQIPILIAEDDPDDRMFMREAFGDSDFDHDIAFVENGEELLAYLNGEGEYAGRQLPELILLDLNMPKMDGRTALLHIKANPLLRRIPIIILTTSKADDDIEKTYDLGVSSYISKPSSAEGLKEVITTLNSYWSNLVALPSSRKSSL